MDFYNIRKKRMSSRSVKEYDYELVPDFRVCRSKDLMTRGGSFYAVWDQVNGLWSEDEYTVCDIIDRELNVTAKEIEEKEGRTVSIKYMHDFSTGTWKNFHEYLNKLPNTYHELNSKIIFANDKTDKNDYASHKLSYSLERGEPTNWNKLLSVLYSDENRQKIEWCIGAIFSGDSKKIQKFLVLYGEAGTGKSTILNIVQMLFDGYYATYEANAITSNNNTFATEAFRSNPLVAIQHDGDLSNISDNSKLNSIISHEKMTINEKYKSSYTSSIHSFLFMASNKPVKITDSKSGLIRRLIDVHPTGNRIAAKEYKKIMSKIPFELGKIANRCLSIYKKGGQNYYDDYRPLLMMFSTDIFFNYVDEFYPVFKEQDYCTLKQAYEMYKTYCSDSNIDKIMPKYKFRDELRDYFEVYTDRGYLNGERTRNYYEHFLSEKFVQAKLNSQGTSDKKIDPWLNLCSKDSIFDRECANCPAQLTNDSGAPLKKWSDVRTKLRDIDTNKLHYVRVPENHIVIDFDLKNESGEKSATLNLQAASMWPETYAEFSKSGGGVHLHYIYDGDPKRLSRVYSEGVEIKVYSGNSSLRRKLTKCNHHAIAHINSGLPLKKGPMINYSVVKTEKSLRKLIERNLRKEIHCATKPSIDFIYKILNDAYNDENLEYDVSDMRQRVLAFANNSSHHAKYCIQQVLGMHFRSKSHTETSNAVAEDGRIVFFDVEVFPNLFLINWKYDGDGDQCARMINPKPEDIEALFEMRLVGFNNRRYDNHILYARYLGYTNQQLFEYSQKLINDSKDHYFMEAYNISYTDVYDFASAGHKKSLKKWEIELGLHHQELGLPWDKPVDESLWPKVAEYCDNDVISTEAVFHHLQADFEAREILADIAGGTPNDSTNSLTTRIIFGDNRHPQLEYTDLSKLFPGYKYEFGKNLYLGEDVGRGGYVYAEPGMYGDAITLDIASMHPHSLIALNYCGEYTKKFKELVDTRVDIKHGDYKSASKRFDGKLKKYLTDKKQAKALSGALKTAINSVYGLTSASFENPFYDIRNKNNIVALRGALFMVKLKKLVQEKGYTVIHIKTDSIKIAKPDQSIIDFCCAQAKEYGYEFEVEAKWDRICLVNNAVFIGHQTSDSPQAPGKWTATGAQFAQPYVFKTLFSKEPLEFKDYCETKSVTTAMYLDNNESIVKQVMNDRRIDYNTANAFVNSQADDKYHDYKFVGKTASYVPVKPMHGGGVLVRKKDDKYSAVTGTKGYRWMESEFVEKGKSYEFIDETYHRHLVDEAVQDISKFGSFDWLTAVSDTNN